MLVMKWWNQIWKSFLKIVKSNVKIVDFLPNEVVIYAIYKFHISSQFLFVGESADNINRFDGDISVIEIF